MNALGLAINVLMMTELNIAKAQKIPETIPGLNFSIMAIEFLKNSVMHVMPTRIHRLIRLAFFCEIIHAENEILS